jgi:hypothetical protein
MNISCVQRGLRIASECLLVLPVKASSSGCVRASTENGESVRPLRQRSERMKKERKHYAALITSGSPTIRKLTGDSANGGARQLAISRMRFSAAEIWL